jgi:hypothetical protein
MATPDVALERDARIEPPACEHGMSAARLRRDWV